MSTPAIQYQSALRTDAKPYGKPRRKYPLPQQSPIQLDAYAFDQDFEMLLSSFPPAQKNALASSFSAMSDANAILTGYSQPADSGAGMGKFTATFHRVPASWDDWETFVYTFPGYPGYLQLPTGIITPVGRNPVTLAVTSRVRYDYFLVDATGATTAKDSGGGAISVVTNANLIAKIGKLLYPGLANPSFFNNFVAPAGGITFGGLTYLETVPNQAVYQAMVAIAAATGPNKGWLGTVYNASAPVPATDSQVVAEDSRLICYAGNIWQRATRYVLAF